LRYQLTLCIIYLLFGVPEKRRIYLIYNVEFHAMESKIQFLTAKVKLLHMAGYAHTMIRTMSYGLLKAIKDNDFFEQPVRDLFPSATDDQLSEIIKLKRDRDLDQALNGAKAASLIFVHTGLESCIETIARFGVEQNPYDWVHLFGNKKITINEVIDNDSSELMKNYASKYLKAFSRETLPEKAKILLSVLKPESGQYRSYRYNYETLDRIDRLRHQCAHGEIDLADFSNIYSDIDYLKSTGEYFLHLMAIKHNVSVD